MKILHLSDTTLSGSPIRISQLLNKYTDDIESRHIVFQKTLHHRVFDTDMVAPEMDKEALHRFIYEWADIIHYHNRWERQQVFDLLGTKPPKKPSVIQMHSPRREDENFEAEAKSGLPLAIIAQYHPREWPELSFIVPNVVDIWDPTHRGMQSQTMTRPLVTYAPSNTKMKKWNNKGFSQTHPVLKDLMQAQRIHYHLIAGMPHRVTMSIKRESHIGVDEIVTGSYHLSSLEYLSMGAACFAQIDDKCERVLKDLTGADWLPWTQANPVTFQRTLSGMLRQQSYKEAGRRAREWMETYWSPERLVQSYRTMYEKL